MMVSLLKMIAHQSNILEQLAPQVIERESSEKIKSEFAQLTEQINETIKLMDEEWIPHEKN